MMSRKIKSHFKIISYNVLSQTLLNNHKYLYQQCRPEHLDWSNRGARLITGLLHKRADIICLQEVENEHLESLFKPKFRQNGYGCLYKKKTGLGVDGCAIFFKKTRFELMDSKEVEFNQSDTAGLLNKDNVGIIAVLRSKRVSSRPPRSASKLIVATTHLLFNPKRDDIRLAQLKFFLFELNKMSSTKHSDHRKHSPTILCGDFNSYPESIVARYLLKQKQRSSDSRDSDSQPETTSSSNSNTDQWIDEAIESLSSKSAEPELNDNPFTFRSAFPFFNREGEPYASSISHHIVDYIMYTSNLRLITAQELMTDQAFKAMGPVPNSEFPSDHLPLMARFCFR